MSPQRLPADPGVLISVGEVCLLQHDQLQWAIVEFCQAITRLDENLRGMATGVRDLADDACAALFAAVVSSVTEFPRHSSQ